MQETRQITCKQCGRLKTAFLAGKYNSKDKKWVDEKGSAFNGRTCSDCNIKRVRNVMRKVRDREQQP